MWELPWDTSTFTAPSGYALRVDFTDTLFGVQEGVNAANNIHNVVPEPSTFLLLGTGLAAFLGYGWRRQQWGKTRVRI
jgi:hypothetical protein